MVHQLTQFIILLVVAVSATFLLLSMQSPCYSVHNRSLKKTKRRTMKIENKGVEVDEMASTTKEELETVTKPGFGRSKKAVVIFASTRSGSSFLGEFLNKHPEVYYLFEPLHGFGPERKNSEAIRKTILSDIFKCNYSRVTEIYKDHKADGWGECNTNVCFAERSNFLRRISELQAKKKTISGVKKFDVGALENACRRSLFTAVKVVEMPSLQEFESLLSDPEIDLRVIQLVRDPRAVVPSQRIMLRAKKVTLVSLSKDLCKVYSESVSYVNSCISGNRKNNTRIPCSDEIRNLWKGRFMRISHEFVSARPFQALKLIYDFIGVNFTTDVVDWLRDSTTYRPQKTSEEKFFGTSRNSKSVISKWRMKESLNDIQEIQRLCIPAMNDLGYVPTWTEADLRNISTPLYNFNHHNYICAYLSD